MFSRRDQTKVELYETFFLATRRINAVCRGGKDAFVRFRRPCSSALV